MTSCRSCPPFGSLAQADYTQDAPAEELSVGIQLGSPGGQRPQEIRKFGGRPQLQIPCQDTVHGHPGLQTPIALQCQNGLLQILCIL